jgi:hypothetical protein
VNGFSQGAAKPPVFKQVGDLEIAPPYYADFTDEEELVM